MFDVSFSELVVIAIVALIVIGPERLPKVARTLGALTGRIQKFVVQVKEEVNREVRFQELQQLQQEIQAKASNVQDAVMNEIAEVTTIAQSSIVQEKKINTDKPVEPLAAILSVKEDTKVADKKKKLPSKTTTKSAKKISES